MEIQPVAVQIEIHSNLGVMALVMGKVDTRVELGWVGIEGV